MKIFKGPHRKEYLIFLAALAAGLILFAAVAAVHHFGSGQYSPRVIAKINEAAAHYGKTADEVKKDAKMMQQIVMEAQQEETMEQLEEKQTVTPEEMANYKAMIGNTMDSKKALIIMFNTEAECSDFIQKHGADDDPLKPGLGVVPMMEKDSQDSQYYNVVGNAVLEPIFDSLADGQYAKEPIEMSGVYCYLKRLKISSPISNDQELIRLIKQEKASAALQKNNQGGEK